MTYLLDVGSTQGIPYFLPNELKWRLQRVGALFKQRLPWSLPVSLLSHHGACVLKDEGNAGWFDTLPPANLSHPHAEKFHQMQTFLCGLSVGLMDLRSTFVVEAFAAEEGERCFRHGVKG